MIIDKSNKFINPHHNKEKFTTDLPSILEIFGTKSSIKILEFLVIVGEDSISNIIKNTDLNHSIVSKNIKLLKKNNILIDKYFGKNRIIRWQDQIP